MKMPPTPSEGGDSAIAALASRLNSRPVMVLPVYSGDFTQFDTWISDFKNITSVYKMSDEDKLALLGSHLSKSPQARAEHDNLYTEATTKPTVFDDYIVALKKALSPAGNSFTYLLEFHNRERKSKETLHEFVNASKKLLLRAVPELADADDKTKKIRDIFLRMHLAEKLPPHIASN